MATDTEAPPEPTPIPARGEGVHWPREAPEFQFLNNSWQRVDDLAKLEPLALIEPAQLGSWIAKLKQSNITAARHNCPELIQQIQQALRRPIDTVLCCVVDADPLAALNSALAARFPLELTAGVVLLGRITHAPNVTIVTDARVPWSWLGPLNRTCKGSGIRVEPIINDYPQADPTLLLYTMLGRRLRPGRLPTEQGVVLLDAAAAIAVGRAALLDEAMSLSPLVVRDHELERSHYLVAAVGTKLAEAMERVELPWRTRVVRQGDLLRDAKVDPALPVGSGELIYHTALSPTPINPSPCIRCGWCVDACPTRVQPVSVLEAAQRDDIEMAERAGMEACIECGICSYVCPSLLPLLDGIRRIKQRIAAP